MASPTRTYPNIPDHDVLRKIGGGAYGEVWMARGVTGALRAVKVVWREDFEDARTFEREFEGILKFEPISRDHPGLVNILHVGRSPDSVSFYYYVMELGDDVHTGQEINPIEYEARTLRADGTAGVRLDITLCIDVGVRLSEALNHLHECNLAHRDVKPSNVIFVNGKAKLADIGLVAARGQRTFVGTEGFVPPEGPGSAQADVYSLGKVLYEIATGKDRLDFPELPDELPTGLERKRWLELNKIICDVCEPRISRRKISTAGELATALHNIQKGKRRRRSGLSIWATTLVLLGFAGWASWETIKDSPWLPWKAAVTVQAPIADGMFRVVTTPEGAEVFSQSGDLLGITPTAIMRQKIGTQLSYVIRKNGYRSLEINATLTKAAENDPMLLFGELQNFSPPIPSEKWEDHLGLTYLPDGQEHVSSLFITKQIWQQFIDSTGASPEAVEFLEISENGKSAAVVLASEADASAFSSWLRTEGIRDGFLTADNEVFARRELSFDAPQLSERARNEGLKPFRTVVREYTYGGVQLTTQPPGAEVFLNGASIGRTEGDLPLLIPKVKPGAIELLMILEGYKPLTIQAEIKGGENLPLTGTLEENQGVVFGKPWENGMEMRFMPIGADLMAAVWETRVRDYEAFVAQSNYEKPRRPDFPQTPDHPVIYISRTDAQAFCKWLTEKDRAEERIAQSHMYRLPTDTEWSRMAGLDFEIGDAPGQRDANKPTFYSWGTKWPPPNGHANYADTSAATLPGISADRVLQVYSDGFPRTSPVGSFPPNELGLQDISGNVHEWVSDDMSTTGTSSLGILRGAGWNTYLKENLLIGWRNPIPSSFHGAYYGFRIVLAKIDLPAPEELLPN